MKNVSPLISVLVAQFPVSLEIESNLQVMRGIIAQAQENELVLFPEGALSGYDPDPAFLDDIQQPVLDSAMQTLQNDVNKRKIHLIFGSCSFENGNWYNAGFYLSYNAAPFKYHKVNLATSERDYFSAGDQLPVFRMKVGAYSIVAGMQLCREIRFPEQWQYLSRAGAEILFYLTNAVGDASVVPVWRSHLVSRAAENQRFVLAANNAHKQQKCPTMIVAPSGEVISEVTSAKVNCIRAEIDLSQNSYWYLEQARTDVVKIIGNHYEN
ncbi:MAG: carbon-nitrogen hydrolase family protein [Chloroflexi bacterium]|nr:carbon-nitrogen hydrolase family protein [Chloroflexota bacterium]